MSSVRPEYPRPHFDRSHSWLSLNGEWDFLRDPDESGAQKTWSPTRASGVAERIIGAVCLGDRGLGSACNWLAAGWYRRKIDGAERAGRASA